MIKRPKPAGSGRKSVPLAVRFSKFFVQGKPDECWLWTGSRNTENRSGNGHGRIRVYDASGGDSGRALLAHRVAYELHHGVTVPNHIRVLHHCDVPHCVNPAHLFLGSQADNVADMIAKGRNTPLPGEANGRAVLTENDVRRIRSLVAGGVAIRAIARSFEVAPVLIRMIRDRKIWKDIA